MQMVKIDRIEARMAELGLNQFSAAKQAGLGRDYVRDLIRGKVKHPSAAKLRDLAVALNCSPDYLLGDSDETGVAPSTFEETARPVKLKVERVLRSGYFPPRAHAAPDREFAHWVISAGYEVPEWLELVLDTQVDGEIPGNTLVHLIEPSQYWAGLTDLVVLEETRGEGIYRLVERKIQRVSFSNRGTVYLNGRYGGSWEDLISEAGITSKRGGPNPFADESAEELPFLHNMRITALVLRTYRFYDNGVGVSSIPF